MFFHSQENQKQELSCPVDREELDRQKVTKSLSTRNRWKKIGEKIVCSHFFQNSFQTLKDAFEKVKKEITDRVVKMVTKEILTAAAKDLRKSSTSFFSWGMTYSLVSVDNYWVQSEWARPPGSMSVSGQLRTYPTPNPTCYNKLNKLVLLLG